MRILLVEDEKKIASFIERGLKAHRYVVDTAVDGETGLELAEVNSYDLIILDIMLPGKDGITVCKELRDQGLESPIMMLTAKSSVADKVHALHSGADDYLVKPFSFEEFTARVAALLRRTRKEKSSILEAGDIVLDQMTHKVKKADKEIALTPKEYSLLEYFMLHADQVITRTMISEHVWNEDFDSFSNIIDVFVNNLRSKLDSDRKKSCIQTVRGVGYTLKSKSG
ncbi:MAG: response regulator transcription factor [Candidatus Omnitrophica bacterium]|nr:response regulator transcription factor [Candidatus Omnitrophota bacterium]